MTSKHRTTAQIPITPPYRKKEREVEQSLMHINRHRAYLTDLYASLLDMKWRYLLSIFAGVYFLTNAVFATLFFLWGD